MCPLAQVDIDQALRTPQFYLLWSNLFCNGDNDARCIAV